MPRKESTNGCVLPNKHTRENLPSEELVLAMKTLGPRMESCVFIHAAAPKPVELSKAGRTEGNMASAWIPDASQSLSKGHLHSAVS